jgi:hypothetical protein
MLEYRHLTTLWASKACYRDTYIYYNRADINQASKCMKQHYAYTHCFTIHLFAGTYTHDMDPKYLKSNQNIIQTHRHANQNLYRKCLMCQFLCSA